MTKTTHTMKIIKTLATLWDIICKIKIKANFFVLLHSRVLTQRILEKKNYYNEGS